MVELTFSSMAVIALLAFMCEYSDATLGMGYGTILTPLLLLFGFEPLEIVPAVLVSQLVCGLLAGIFHHREGNVNFSVKSIDPIRIVHKLSKIGLREGFRQGISTHLKIVIVLVSGGIIGAFLGASMGGILPAFWVQVYIGVVVVLMGILILVFFKKRFTFSWFKLASLGVLASFNKGLTGGGYGPIVASGQIFSGVSARNAVGITALAEGVTSLAGVCVYFFFMRGAVNWQLAPIIIVGAVFSVPLSAKTVKFIRPQWLKMAIGIATIILGSFTLIRIFT